MTSNKDFIHELFSIQFEISAFPQKQSVFQTNDSHQIRVQLLQPS